MDISRNMAMPRSIAAATLLFETEPFRCEPNIRQRVLAELDAKFEQAQELGCQLIVTSEAVGALGQTIDQAESLDKPGEVLSRYSRFARSQRCVVAGSIKLIEGNRLYNAIVFVDADGVPCGRYRKTYLTDQELHEGFTPGPGDLAVDTTIGKLAGAICYDLNFPEIRQATARQRPDVICFASMYHGGHVQYQWAYEARAYFVAALPFHGGALLNPLGMELAKTDCYHRIAQATLHLDRVLIHLDYNAQKFSALRRKYGAQIRLEVPANLGSALLCAVDTQGPTAAEIVAREELLVLDDYFDRSRQRNQQAR